MNDRNGHPLLIGATCVVLRSPGPGYVGRIMRIVGINMKHTECVELDAEGLKPIAVRPTWITVTQDPPIKQRLATPRNLAVQRDREAILAILAQNTLGLTTTQLCNVLRRTTGVSLQRTNMLHRLRDLMATQHVERLDIPRQDRSAGSSRHLYRLTTNAEVAP